MSETVELQRTFLLRDAEGRNVDVTAKLARLSGNRLAHFSITNQNGSAHDRIQESATPDIADDIRALVAMHLRDASGVPTHALANTAHFMRQGDFETAQRILGAGTVADLHKVYGDAATRNVSTILDTLAKAKEAIAEAVKPLEAVTTRIDRQNQRHREGTSSFPALRKDEKEREERIAEVASLLGRKPAEMTLGIAKDAVANLPERLVDSIKKKHDERCLNEALAEHVAKVCRPVWDADLKRAREILSQPDYRAEGRPAIDDDATTYKGFVHSLGAEFEVRRIPQRTDGFMADMKFHYAWELRTLTATFGDEVSANVQRAFGLDEIMEMTVRSLADVETLTRDEFIDEMGFARDGVKGVRLGERAYAHAEGHNESFVSAFGEDAYRSLLTRVGDDPPLTEEHFERNPSPVM